jgi:hypothetical protein
VTSVKPIRVKSLGNLHGVDDGASNLNRNLSGTHDTRLASSLIPEAIATRGMPILRWGDKK